jgi:Xaa-Pro aminopeptidase
MNIRPKEKQIRESLSFKQHEAYLLETRDSLCQHYKLNKSDLVKFLIKKEHQILKTPETYLFK